MDQFGSDGDGALNVSLNLGFEARFVKAGVTIAIREEQGIRASALLALVATTGARYQVIGALVEGNGCQCSEDHTLNPSVEPGDRQ